LITPKTFSKQGNYKSLTEPFDLKGWDELHSERNIGLNIDEMF